MIKKSNEASWIQFQLPSAPVGGMDALFTIRCFDWDANGAHDLIGECETTIRDLTLGPVQLALVNPNKRGRYVLAACYYRDYTC